MQTVRHSSVHSFENDPQPWWARTRTLRGAAEGDAIEIVESLEGDLARQGGEGIDADVERELLGEVGEQEEAAHGEDAAKDELAVGWAEKEKYDQTVMTASRSSTGRASSQCKKGSALAIQSTHDRVGNWAPLCSACRCWRTL